MVFIKRHFPFVDPPLLSILSSEEPEELIPVQLMKQKTHNCKKTKNKKLKRMTRLEPSCIQILDF